MLGVFKVAKGLIIFGNNKLAQLMLKYVMKYTDYEFLGFCVDRTYLRDDSFAGYSNIAFEDLENKYPKNDIEILICIGNNKMNDIRKAVYNNVKKCGYKVAQFIHPTANIETNCIGEGNIILENVNLSMGVELGVCNVLWNGCNLSHDVSVGDFNYITASVVVAGNARIKNNCFIGIGSAVRSGIEVASYTFIGAGCYLNNSTEPEDVYVPARAVKLERKSAQMSIN